VRDTSAKEGRVGERKKPSLRMGPGVLPGLALAMS